MNFHNRMADPSRVKVSMELQVSDLAMELQWLQMQLTYDVSSRAIITHASTLLAILSDADIRTVHLFS